MWFVEAVGFVVMGRWLHGAYKLLLCDRDGNSGMSGSGHWRIGKEHD
jgi:hypothetical protein